jgi:hypothetical protein
VSTMRLLVTPSMFTNIEGVLPSKRNETACVLAALSEVLRWKSCLLPHLVGVSRTVNFPLISLRGIFA